METLRLVSKAREDAESLADDYRNKYDDLYNDMMRRDTF